MPALPVAILAGGLGSRLRPITESCPKALMQINGRPFLAYQIELLRMNGIERIVLCVGYLGEMIEKEFGDGTYWGVKIEYSYDGPKLLGTGGALRKALPKLGREFFILYGDAYLDIDYQAISDFYSQSRQKGLMTVYANQNQWDTSNVEFGGGEIKAYSKKFRTPAMRHIDYGLNILHSEVIEELPETEPTDLADVFSRLVERRNLVGYEVFTRFFEIGSKSGILEFEQYLNLKQKMS